MTSVQPEAVIVNRGQPGEVLRKAREGRNLALDEVAASLNLSPVALNNLESGAFDRLPGHTFARGYIRAYAKFMGMDQDLLVRLFDQTTGTDATGSSVNSLGQIEEPSRVSQGLLRMVSLVGLSILVLAGFLWWQDSASVDDNADLSRAIDQVEIESANGTTQVHPLEPEDQAVELTQEEIVTISPEAVVAAGQGSVPADAQPAAEDPATPAISAVQPSPVIAVVADQPSAPALVVPTTPSVPVAPATTVPGIADAGVVAGAGEGLLSISFTANCWTQVADADGKVLVSGLKKPGDTINLAVKLPLDLRLGYVSGARVTFNGTAVDMSAFTTGETARRKLGQ